MSCIAAAASRSERLQVLVELLARIVEASARQALAHERLERGRGVGTSIPRRCDTPREPLEPQAFADSGNRFRHDECHREVDRAPAERASREVRDHGVGGCEARERGICAPDAPCSRGTVGDRDVHDEHVAAHALDLLQIPRRERVVVPVRQEQRIAWQRLDHVAGVPLGESRVRESCFR